WRLLFPNFEFFVNLKRRTKNTMKRFFSAFCLISAVACAFLGSLDAQGNPEAIKLVRQGSDAAKEKDWDAAIDAFTKANNIDHKFGHFLVAALQQRATAEVADRRYSEAI